MKNVLVAFLSILMLFSFLSCQAETETATLRIELNKRNRTVKPEEESMEIYGYRIITVGPDGKESNPHYTYYSYLNLDGLNVGKWKIKVFGFNSERKDLAYGEGEISLISGKNTIAISLDELIGKGNLSLSLKWDEDVFRNVYYVHTMFKSQNGKEITLSPSTPRNGESTIIYENLPSGSYDLQIELRDKDDKKIAGAYESIRITSDTTTEGHVKFSSPEELPSSEITISNNTATPVEVMINGVESLMEANKQFSVNIKLPTNSKLTLNDLNTVWYLDGKEIGRGSSLTIEDGVDVGLHRLDVSTMTIEKGSKGSTSFVFQAASSADEGDLYQKITMKSSSELYIGKKARLGFLPDNRLLIVSNQYKKVQLVNVSKSNYQILATYSYEELQINGEVQTWITNGSKDDGYYSVLFFCNKTSSCEIINFIISKNQISYNDKEDSFDKNGGINRVCRFVDVAEGDRCFMALMESTDKTRLGYIFLNPKPQKGKIVQRELCPVREPEFDYGYTGFKAVASAGACGTFIIISGQRAKTIHSRLSQYGYTEYGEDYIWSDFDELIKYYDEGKFKPEYLDARSCGFLSNDGVYNFVFSTEGIYYYKETYENAHGYSLYKKEVLEEDSKIRDIKMTKDLEYGYMIDGKNNRLYTLYVARDEDCGGLVLQKGNYITLNEDNIDNTIKISDDGSLIVVYNMDEGNTATVIKASRKNN